MKMIKILGLTLASAGMMTITAQAIPVTGTVDMSGSATLDNVLLGSANGATAFSAVTVGGTSSGTFAGTGGASVTWTPFNWNPSSTPVTPLWTYISGLNTYSFDLTTLSIVSQTDSFLNLSGNGVLKATGHTDTAGAWAFTISNAGGGAHADFKFTFANSQTAAVPDGGSTLILLGSAIVGLFGIARKSLRIA